ncbi:cysteine--tRNA ligase [Candidatus Pacearchaeota archaeon]|nr:cysteine--tRNA ligase [Candidatus Pacearchaeota archaeon]
MLLYNTLTRKKEEFKPIKPGNVGMYVCGPTVNNVPHLGHARAQISFDILRRYLIFSGYKVKFVSNITDIEDKIINKAKELNESIESLTKRNTLAHLKDYFLLNIGKPDVQPKATEYVKEMIELVKKLEEKGYTYLIEGDGVYYDVSKFKDYGNLSHQNIENLKSGARVKANEEKKNKEDFVLWKFSKPGEPEWDSPWGAGRPGWHAECSAMSYSILGLPFDIHGGGQDLIFPHHEDEIAQSEAAYGKKIANFWIHNGMINVDKVKMSKSLGNFRTIKDVLKNYNGTVIRYFIISNQYRQAIDFNKKILDDSKTAYERLKNIIFDIRDDKKKNEEYLDEFRKAMDDDLNTPKALAVLWNLVRDEKAKGKLNTIKEMDKVLGLSLLEKEKIVIPKDVKELVEQREETRKAKDWKLADELRKKISEKGFMVEDKKEGYKLSKR